MDTQDFLFLFNVGGRISRREAMTSKTEFGEKFGSTIGVDRANISKLSGMFSVQSPSKEYREQYHVDNVQ